MKKRLTNILYNEFFSILPGNVLTILTTTLCVLMNGLIAGNYLGSLELAAIGLTAPLLMVISAIAGMFSVGTTDECTRAIATCDRKKANAVFSTSIVFEVGTGLIVSIITLVIPGVVSKALGASNELIEYVTLYLKGFAICFIPTMITRTLSSFVHMGRKSYRAVIASIIKLFVNFAVDYYFIIYLNKGIFYAGIATAVGAIAEMLYIWIAFKAEKGIIRFKADLIRIKELLNVIKFGLRTFLMNISFALRNIYINYLLIESGGADAVTGWTVMLNAAVILDAFGEGTTISVSTLFNIAVGEKDKEAMRKIWRLSCEVGQIPLIIVYSGYLIFAGKIGDLFGVSDITQKYVYWFVIGYVFICVVGQLCDMMLTLWQNIGEVKEVAFLSVLTYGVAPILLCTLLVRSIGCYGIVFGIILSYVLCVVVFFIISWIKNKGFPNTMEKIMLIKRKVKDCPTLSTTINDINGVVRFSEDLSQFCKKNNIDNRRAYFISLSLEEMGVNIVEHGFPKMNNPQIGTIDILAQVENDTVYVRLRDNAREFDPNERLKLIENEADNVDRYIGIRMVNKLQKQIKYQNLLGKNVLIISI